MLVLGDIAPEFSVAHLCIFVFDLDLNVFLAVEQLDNARDALRSLLDFENGQVFQLGTRVDLEKVAASEES